MCVQIKLFWFLVNYDLHKLVIIQPLSASQSAEICILQYKL